MPYKFQYFIDNHVNFECQLNSVQCQGHTKTNARCKRRCIIPFEFCPIHLANIKHLKVSSSLIPNSGKGLFAFDRLKDDNDIVFKKNDKIAEYNGLLRTTDEINNNYQYNTAPYAVKLSNNYNIDCACKRSVGSLINNKPNHNNSTFVINTRDKKISIKATKNIRNYEEIYLAYGNNYNFQNNFITKPTRK